MNENEEFVQEFLVECEENLDQVDQDLIALEQAPRDTERLASIFRSIHTIKGTSGFFGFSKLGAIAHVGENLLSRLRDGELLLDEETTTALLDMVDAIREIAGFIEQEGNEGTGDYRDLTARITSLSQRPGVGPAADAADEVGQGITPAAIAEQPEAEAELSAGGEVAEAAEAEGAEQVELEAAEPAAAEVAERGPAEDEPVAIEPPPEDVSSEVSEPEPSAETSGAPRSEGSIRVDVGLLDKLMNLVGELVLTRNQIRPFGESTDDRGLSSASQQLDLITSELQEGVMRTRMQPIRNILAKFPRVVRDLSVSSGKQVELIMEGQDTELDRTLIESIRDPLTHLVRNAVDHGIESPEQRIARGKPACGRIVLRAFHEGGLVNIELSDDGAGIDPERIRSKALERGLISHDHSRQMSDHQLIQLIFMPGLSTADKVTAVSGRGVGMDVVKTNVERIGGTMDIESHIGQGTLLRIKIPLTLAIIPALMVSSGGQQFAVPQVSLREILTLTDRSPARLDHIQGAPFYRLRGELLPLVELNRVLGLEGVQLECVDRSVNILVLHAEGMRFGLVVDSVLNAEEIVVKPLHKALSRLPFFSGATILGNGRISLILDIVGLGHHAGLSIAGRTVVSESEPVGEPAAQFDEYLICMVQDDRRAAIPLGEIERLEEVRLDDVETTGSQPVIQYRGQVMSLLRSGDCSLSALGTDGLLRVVVKRIGQKYVGLTVRRILDVWQAEQALDASQSRPGVRGITVLQRQITDVIDIDQLAQMAGIVSDVTAAETAT